MGTNYYVQTPPCPSACAHCSDQEQLHLGKSSGGWRFLFRADPDWPRQQAFARWLARAAAGRIEDEYGAEQARQDGHTGACGPLAGTGDPEPTEPANGRQTGAQPLDYPDAAANAEAENAWRKGEDHL